MKEKEERPGIVPQNEYQPELEAKVSLEVARINLLPRVKVTKKYSRTEVPNFGTDLRAKAEWETEEIRRCIDGYDGLPGRYYMFLNHCWIKNKDKRRSRIMPDFRAIDLEWFRFLEDVEKTPGRGVVCIKRRQVGMSWKAALDVLYGAQFNQEYMVGMNSKTESDGWDLLGKVKYLHRSLPEFLQSAINKDRRDQIGFVTTGSSIKVKAPTDNAHASEQYTKLIIDEGGELVNLDALWSTAEPCLESSPGIRVSPVILFGTVGDILKGGKGLMGFWKNAEMYDMSKFAFWGYNACLMDELGNDLIEDSVRWILYTRKKKESGSTRLYQKFIQNYPLHEGDAFLTSENSGVGNPIEIAHRISIITEEKPIKRIGWMKPSGEFYPDPNGQIIIYKLPDPNVTSVAACDPAEDDDVEKSRDTSDLATAIMSHPVGLNPPKILAEFCHRPKKLDEYYQQLAWLLSLYKAKLDIEMNKGGWRAFKWFEAHYPHLLALAPAPVTDARTKSTLKYGVKMTTITRPHMWGLLEDYLENYLDHIDSERFLRQCLVWGSKHEDDDLADAVGWCLMRLQSDSKLYRLRQQTEQVTQGAKLVNVGGKLVWQKNEPRVKDLTPSQPLLTPKTSLSEDLSRIVREKSRSSLFKR
jgi:hypothetical protein